MRRGVEVPESLPREAARVVLDRTLAFITGAQNPDGSWCGSAPDSVMELGYSPETYYTWQLGAIHIALLSLMECDETPERRATLEKGMKWFCQTRLPARGSDWDVDYMWPSLYGVVTAARAARADGAVWMMWHVDLANPDAQAFYVALGAARKPTHLVMTLGTAALDALVAAEHGRRTGEI